MSPTAGLLSFLFEGARSIAMDSRALWCCHVVPDSTPGTVIVLRHRGYEGGQARRSTGPTQQFARQRPTAPALMPFSLQGLGQRSAGN